MVFSSKSAKRTRQIKTHGTILPFQDIDVDPDCWFEQTTDSIQHEVAFRTIQREVYSAFLLPEEETCVSEASASDSPLTNDQRDVRNTAMHKLLAYMLSSKESYHASHLFYLVNLIVLEEESWTKEKSSIPTSHLFSEEDKALARSILSLSAASRHLLARLLFRKHIWQRFPIALTYPETIAYAVRSLCDTCIHLASIDPDLLMSHKHPQYASTHGQMFLPSEHHTPASSPTPSLTQDGPYPFSQDYSNGNTKGSNSRTASVEGNNVSGMRQTDEESDASSSSRTAMRDHAKAGELPIGEEDADVDEEMQEEKYLASLYSQFLPREYLGKSSALRQVLLDLREHKRSTLAGANPSEARLPPSICFSCHNRTTTHRPSSAQGPMPASCSASLQSTPHAPSEPISDGFASSSFLSAPFSTASTKHATLTIASATTTFTPSLSPLDPPPCMCSTCILQNCLSELGTQRLVNTFDTHMHTNPQTSPRLVQSLPIPPPPPIQVSLHAPFSIFPAAELWKIFSSFPVPELKDLLQALGIPPNRQGYTVLQSQSGTVAAPIDEKGYQRYTLTYPSLSDVLATKQGADLSMTSTLVPEEPSIIGAKPGQKASLLHHLHTLLFSSNKPTALDSYFTATSSTAMPSSTPSATASATGTAQSNTSFGDGALPLRIRKGIQKYFSSLPVSCSTFQSSPSVPSTPGAMSFQPGSSFVLSDRTLTKSLPSFRSPYPSSSSNTASNTNTPTSVSKNAQMSISNALPTPASTGAVMKTPKPSKSSKTPKTPGSTLHSFWGKTGQPPSSITRSTIVTPSSNAFRTRSRTSFSSSFASISSPTSATHPVHAFLQSAEEICIEVLQTEEHAICSVDISGDADVIDLLSESEGEETEEIRKMGEEKGKEDIEIHELDEEAEEEAKKEAKDGENNRDNIEEAKEKDMHGTEVSLDALNHDEENTEGVQPEEDAKVFEEEEEDGEKVVKQHEDEIDLGEDTESDEEGVYPMRSTARKAPPTDNMSYSMKAGTFNRTQHLGSTTLQTPTVAALTATSDPVSVTDSTRPAVFLYRPKRFIHYFRVSDRVHELYAKVFALVFPEETPPGIMDAPDAHASPPLPTYAPYATHTASSISDPLLSLPIPNTSSYSTSITTSTSIPILIRPLDASTASRSTGPSDQLLDTVEYSLPIRASNTSPNLLQAYGILDFYPFPSIRPLIATNTTNIATSATAPSPTPEFPPIPAAIATKSTTSSLSTSSSAASSLLVSYPQANATVSSHLHLPQTVQTTLQMTDHTTTPLFVTSIQLHLHHLLIQLREFVFNNPLPGVDGQKKYDEWRNELIRVSKQRKKDLEIQKKLVKKSVETSKQVNRKNIRSGGKKGTAKAIELADDNSFEVLKTESIEVQNLTVHSPNRKSSVASRSSESLPRRQSPRFADRAPLVYQEGDFLEEESPVGKDNKALLTPVHMRTKANMHASEGTKEQVEDEAATGEALGGQGIEGEEESYSDSESHRKRRRLYKRRSKKALSIAVSSNTESHSQEESSLKAVSLFVPTEGNSSTVQVLDKHGTGAATASRTSISYTSQVEVGCIDLIHGDIAMSSPSIPTSRALPCPSLPPPQQRNPGEIFPPTPPPVLHGIRLLPYLPVFLGHPPIPLISPSSTVELMCPVVHALNIWCNHIRLFIHLCTVPPSIPLATLPPTNKPLFLPFFAAWIRHLLHDLHLCLQVSLSEVPCLCNQCDPMESSITPSKTTLATEDRVRSSNASSLSDKQRTLLLQLSTISTPNPSNSVLFVQSLVESYPLFLSLQISLTISLYEFTEALVLSSNVLFPQHMGNPYSTSPSLPTNESVPSPPTASHLSLPYAHYCRLRHTSRFQRYYPVYNLQSTLWHLIGLVEKQNIPHFAAIFLSQLLASDLTLDWRPFFTHDPKEALEIIYKQSEPVLAPFAEKLKSSSTPPLYPYRLGNQWERLIIHWKTIQSITSMPPTTTLSTVIPHSNLTPKVEEMDIHSPMSPIAFSPTVSPTSPMSPSYLPFSPPVSSPLSSPVSPTIALATRTTSSPPCVHPWMWAYLALFSPWVQGGRRLTLEKRAIQGLFGMQWQTQKTAENSTRDSTLEKRKRKINSKDGQNEEEEEDDSKTTKYLDPGFEREERQGTMAFTGVQTQQPKQTCDVLPTNSNPFDVQSSVALSSRSLAYVGLPLFPSLQIQYPGPLPILPKAYAFLPPLFPRTNALFAPLSNHPFSALTEEALAQLWRKVAMTWKIDMPFVPTTVSSNTISPLFWHLLQVRLSCACGNTPGSDSALQSLQQFFRQAKDHFSTYSSFFLPLPSTAHGSFSPPQGPSPDRYFCAHHPLSAPVDVLLEGSLLPTVGSRYPGKSAYVWNDVHVPLPQEEMLFQTQQHVCGESSEVGFLATQDSFTQRSLEWKQAEETGMTETMLDKEEGQQEHVHEGMAKDGNHGELGTDIVEEDYSELLDAETIGFLDASTQELGSALQRRRVRRDMDSDDSDGNDDSSSEIFFDEEGGAALVDLDAVGLDVIDEDDRPRRNGTNNGPIATSIPFQTFCSLQNTDWMDVTIPPLVPTYLPSATVDIPFLSAADLPSFPTLSSTFPSDAESDLAMDSSPTAATSALDLTLRICSRFHIHPQFLTIQLPGAVAGRSMFQRQRSFGVSRAALQDSLWRTSDWDAYLASEEMYTRMMNGLSSYKEHNSKENAPICNACVREYFTPCAAMLPPKYTEVAPRASFSIEEIALLWYATYVTPSPPQQESSASSTTANAAGLLSSENQPISALPASVLPSFFQSFRFALPLTWNIFPSSPNGTREHSNSAPFPPLRHRDPSRTFHPSFATSPPSTPITPLLPSGREARLPWYGFACEGDLLRYLFILLLWEQLTLPCVDTQILHSCLYFSAPENLYTSLTNGMYTKNQPVLQRRLEYLCKLSRNELSKEIGIAWRRYFGMQIRHISWTSYSLQTLQLIAMGIGSLSLSLLFDHMLSSIRLHLSGCPDLLLFRVISNLPSDSITKHGRDVEISTTRNVSEPHITTISPGVLAACHKFCPHGPDILLPDHVQIQVRFVEVKGVSDRLSEKQEHWLLTLLRCGVSAGVCRVIRPEKGNY